MKTKGKLNNWIKSLIVIGVIIAVWGILAGMEVFSAYVFPGPGRVWRAFVSMVSSGELVRNMGASVLRVLVGFIISTILAFALGVIATWFPGADPYYRPIVEFIRHIPPLSLIPLLILWCGIGEPPKIIIIVLTAFFPIFMNTLSGIEGCDVRLLEVGEILHMKQSQIFMRIRVPAALPNILVGMQIGLGYSWRAIVGAEMIAASKGLGYMILDAQAMSRTDKVLVGIILIGILGLIMDKGFELLVKKLNPAGRANG